MNPASPPAFRRARRIAVAAFLGLLLASLPARAGGEVDATYRSGGVAIDSLGAQDQFLAVKVQPDGKIVAAGLADIGPTRHFTVVRRNADGTRDATFGTGGVVTGLVGPAQSIATALALQPDGRILVGGHYNIGAVGTRMDWFVARFNADGSADTGFGTAGVATIVPGTADSDLAAIRLQSDGRIVVAGTADSGIADSRFALARLGTGGLPDATFGSGGLATLSLSATEDIASDLLVQPDDRLVVVGRHRSGGFLKTALLRYLADGSALDTSFGTGGIVTPSLGAFDDYAIRGILRGDGYIVLAGHYGTGTPPDRFLVQRHLPDGTLDAAFGSGGFFTYSLGFPNYALASFAIRAGDRYLAAGHGVRDGNVDLVMVGVIFDGTPDNSMGPGGVAVRTITGGEEVASAMVIQSDDRIVLAGSTTDFLGARDSLLVRLESDARYDPTFAPEGAVVARFGASGSDGVAVAVEPSGNMILAGEGYSADGDFAVARFLPDGAPDLAFGIDGKLQVSLDPLHDAIRGLAVTGDGRIVAGGFSNARFAAMRLLPGGALDPGFGSGGIAVIDATQAGLSSFGHAMALQPDASVILAGSAQDGAAINDMAAVRLLVDGTPDPAFGTSGVVRINASDTATGGDIATSVARMPDGRIVLAGVAQAGGVNGVAVVRLNADGTPDASFGTAGVARVAFDAGSIEESALAVAVHPDGRIVVAGYSDDGTVPRAAIMQLGASGAPDPSFGTAGRVVLDAGGLGLENVLRTVKILPGLDIVAAGHADLGTSRAWLAIRLRPDGTLNAGWGTGGIVIHDSSPLDDAGLGLAQDNFGNLVLGGSANGRAAAIRLAAAAQEASLTPTAADFGSRPAIGQAISGMEIFLRNTGDKALAVSAVGFGGAHPGDWSIASSLCGTPPFALPPGGQCTLTVYFGPTAEGARSATFEVTSNAPVALESSALSGTGTDATPDPFAFNALADQAQSTVVQSNAIAVQGIESYTTITVADGEYSIGCVGGFTAAPGLVSAGQAVCVRHTTAAAPGTAVVTTLTIGGVAAGFTSVTALPPSVPASVAADSGSGQSALRGVAFFLPLTVIVRDSANAPVPGVLVSFSAPSPPLPTATLSAATALTDASGMASVGATAGNLHGAYSVTATVAGVAAPAVFSLTNLGAAASLNATQFGFGNRDLNATASSPAITLASVGNTALTGIAIGASGEGFGVTTACPVALAVGATCTLTMTFTPTAEGPRTGQVTVVSNAFASPAVIVVSGNGIDLANPLGDADQDGIPNGVEPAVNTNPLARDNDVFADARLFVMQQYRDFLGREGDAAGIDGWIGLLNAGAYARAQVIDAFVNSPEFGGFVAPVVRLYFATFLRVPDYAGMSFNAGLVRNGTLTVAQLADYFTASPEFQAAYGTLDDAAFVTLLYGNVLGRAPDAAGLAGWVSLLQSGYTRGQVLVGFSESDEYRATMASEVLVTMMYAGMLRRTPEPAGFNGWVAFLDAGTYTREQVINGFFLSTEYHGRFLP